MSDTICCVCQQPAGAAARTFGGRCYCQHHYERVLRDRRGLWQAGLVEILGLLLFVALVELVLSLSRVQLRDAGLLAASIVLAVVPALLWLLFFYRQDRLEPEPRGYVLGVFALGALLAAAIGLPLLRNVFRTADWLGQSFAVNLLGSILVIGFVQEFLKYAAVRYSVYPLTEFDELVDGIVYGTAAGLGFATVLNMNYVLESRGVDLQVGVIQVVVVALAQASFAGITGYFLARAKFEARPIWWVPAGLSLAALLNGLFAFLRGQITRTGINLRSGGGFNPWPGLLLAAGLAVVVFIVLNVLIRRASRAALAEITGETK